MDAAHAPVFGRGLAPQQAAGLEAVDHAAGRRGVEADLARQRALVHARLALGRRERGELHRRQVQALGLRHEQRHRPLLQAPDKVARLQGERQGQGGFGHGQGFPAAGVLLQSLF